MTAERFSLLVKYIFKKVQSTLKLLGKAFLHSTYILVNQLKRIHKKYAYKIALKL